jgi:hypothetical protein
MKIGDIYKKRINDLFKYVVFHKRDTEFIIKRLVSNIRGSDLEALSIPIECFKIENIDATHDKLTLTFDDYLIEGVITWKINESGKSVFLKYH